MTMRSRLLLLVMALAGTPALAGEKAPFTIQDLYRLKGTRDPRISPDGRRVAFTVTSSDLAKAERTTHVWVMDADGGGATELTQSKKKDTEPRWSPDGRWIAFVSSRKDAPNVWLLPTSGGEARQLTKLSTGVDGIVWSPDGKRLAFSSSVYPECGADDACNKRRDDLASKGPLKAHVADRLLYRHWTGWADGHRTHTFVVEVEGGQVRDLTPGDFDAPTFSLGGPLGYAFSPDGKELCFVSNHDPEPESSTNADVWLVPVEGGEPRNITAANRAWDGSPAYSPDGRYIAYRSQRQPAYESDLFSISLYDRQAHTTRVPTAGFDNWIVDLRWAPDSRRIFFTAEVEARAPLFEVDVETGKVQKRLEAAQIDDFDVSPDGSWVALARRSVGEPAEIYRAQLPKDPSAAAEDLKRLTSLNTAVAGEVDIRPAEPIWVSGAGGARIQVFVVKPHAFDPAKKYPLILNVHGGPQSQWADSFRGDWQVYPGAGYVVAFCNPHGSTGYGQAFTAEISGDYGGMVFEDLMKVTDALEKLPYVDKDRMAAMGWSFGGYMMNWFEGHTTRFKAIASMMGLYDLRSFYGATEELWFPEWDLRGRPWDSPLYDRLSPSRFVKSFKTPMLVVTGEKDYRVPYTESLQLFTALQKMKVPSRLVVLPTEGHWPEPLRAMALYYTAHLDWFHRYLGGAPAPWGVEDFARNRVFKDDEEKIKE